MVKQVAIGIFGIALSGVLGCKQAEPVRTIEPAALVGPGMTPSFKLAPGQCQEMDAYKVCRVTKSGADYLVVYRDGEPVVSIALPPAGSGGATTYDGCDCRLLGCRPMC